MALTCGIVGLPNVGKSTLFNALTAAGIQAENYPFCTIEPNTGVVIVPDARLDQLQALIHSKSVVPTTVEFVDIAGLVKGAAQGEGLGNQFLGNIRETNAIIHVVRCFDDENVVHVDGQPDPVRDAETIELELGLADLETVEKRIDRVRRVAKSGDKQARAEQEIFESLRDHLSEGKPARSFPVPDALTAAVREAHLLTAKPVLYVANVDEQGLSSSNDYCVALEGYASNQGAEVVRICGKVEAELSELEDADKREFLADLGIEEPGLNRLIRAAYTLLDLVTFFTAGPKEIRAWTVRRGATAPQAAGEIHSDFEKHFIRAEVIPFDRYVELGGETEAKAKGVMQVEGKEYIVDDGDVIYFRTERLMARRNQVQMTPEEVLATQFGGPDDGVFTDGSSDPNPGPGGWGWVWVEKGEILAQGHGRDPQTTNNRMELTALIEAYKALPSDRDLVIYSDSQLCVNTINEWAAGWERRGWKRKGGPIKNLELVQELYALAQNRPRIELRWIRAHEGTRWNEYADALAALGA